MTAPITRPGLPASLDKQKVVDEAFETDMLSAQRRAIADARRQGRTLTDTEARTNVWERYQNGDKSVLPQFHRIAQRINRK